MGQFDYNYLGELIKEVDFLMNPEKNQFTVIEDPWVEWISKPGNLRYLIPLSLAKLDGFEEAR